MKNKALGFYAAALSAILAIVTLVIALLYRGQGGQVTTLALAAFVGAVVCEVSLLFGEKLWTDFTGIIGAALLAFAMVTILGGGIWNIAEAINGIKMTGLPELFGMNMAMAGINLAAIVAAIVACFTAKSK